MAAPESGRNRSLTSRYIWPLCIYWALEGLPFLGIKLLFNKTPTELAYPYVACAIPGIAFFLFVSRLRQQETEATPKRLALKWGVGGAVFASATVVAVTYSGVSLGLMDRTNALSATIVSVALAAPICFVILRSMALARISSGTLDDPDGAVR